jgi:hypothetical protein
MGGQFLRWCSDIDILTLNGTKEYEEQHTPEARFVKGMIILLLTVHKSHFLDLDRFEMACQGEI